MPLSNYRDLGSAGSDINAGFQFEFYCTKCSYTWKSPFQPYRMGQITGLLSRFAFMFDSLRTSSRTTGAFADIGSSSARQSALDEAMQRAETLFTKCPHCKEVVCQDCFSARDNSCHPCLEEASRTSAEAGAKAQEAQRAAKGHACPNCNTDTQGGRFCPECGYDMASTHKSCPQCGLMMARQARFCTDCGHSF